MELLLALLLLLGTAALEIWTATKLLNTANRANKFTAWYRWTIGLTLALAIATTLLISYHPNPNTRVYGWPVPRVIWQRENATTPWLDYIGPTIVLAYPINFLLFMLPPSVIFLLLTRRCRQQPQPDNQQPPAP